MPWVRVVVQIQRQGQSDRFLESLWCDRKFKIVPRIGDDLALSKCVSWKVSAVLLYDDRMLPHVFINDRLIADDTLDESIRVWRDRGFRNKGDEND